MGNPPTYAEVTPPPPAPAVPVVQAETLIAPVQPATPAEPPAVKIEPAPPGETPVAMIESAPSFLTRGAQVEAVVAPEAPVKRQESTPAVHPPIDKAPAAADAPPTSVANTSIATPTAEMASRAITASSPPDISGAEETAFRSMTGAEDLIPTNAPAALRNTAPNDRQANSEPSAQARPAAEDADGGIASSSPSPLPPIIVKDVQAAPVIAPAPRKATRKQARARRTATRGRRQGPQPAASAVVPFSLPTFSFSPSQPQRPTKRPAQARTRATSPAPSFYAGPGAMPLSQ
jgi:hypothetical protein